MSENPEIDEPRDLHVAWKTLSRVASLALLLMLVMVLTGVLLRAVFSVSLDFTEEFAAYALVALTFFGAPLAYLTNEQMFRVGVIANRLPAFAQSVLSLIWALLSVGVMSVLFSQLIRLTYSSYIKGTIATTSSNTPLYLPQVLMPLGGGILLIAVLIKVRASFKRLKNADQ